MWLDVPIRAESLSSPTVCVSSEGYVELLATSLNTEGNIRDSQKTAECTFPGIIRISLRNNFHLL